MKKIKLTLLSISSILLLNSCASIFSKSTWPVTISSSPVGATISVISNQNGTEIYKGTTPAAVRLKSGAGFFKKASYQVKFTLNGYDEKIVPIECKVNGWYFGNILIGGILGMLIIDPATGAMYKIETDTVFETLVQNSTASNSDKQLKIYDINDIPDDWKSHLVKL